MNLNARPGESVSCLANYSEGSVSHDGSAVSTTTEVSAWKGRVLVGDDEPRLVSSLCAILRAEGFEVDAAGGGHAVCGQVLSTAYDLILLNLCMPGKSGFEVLSWLKEARIAIPVVIISGRSDYRVVRRAFRMGVCDYLRKPYDVDELIRVVDTTIIEQRNARLAAEARPHPRTGAFFQHALDHLPDLIFSVDDSLCINYLNDRVESLLGVSKAKLLGHPLPHLVHADDVAKIPLLFKRAKAGAPVTQEIKLRTCNKEIAHLECEITVVSPPEPNPRAPDGSERFLTSTHLLGIVRDISERKQTLALMEFRASHDSLTGLPNRTLFMDRLALAVSQASRNGQKLAVLFIDLNDFKAVNDTYGHGVGDQLLQHVATALKGCLRDGDTISRYGGDEFTVLLPSLVEKSDAATVARKLLKSLNTPFQVEGPTKVCL